MKIEDLLKIDEKNYKYKNWILHKTKHKYLIIFENDKKIYENTLYSQFWNYIYNLHNMKQGIFCCDCKKEIKAELCFGFEIYPNRTDLFENLFYRCPHCQNYVGTHKVNSCKCIKPVSLGKIVNSNIKKLRMDLHNNYIDPIWNKYKLWNRTEVYNFLCGVLKEDEDYHTADVCCIEDYKKVKDRVIVLQKILKIK